MGVSASRAALPLGSLPPAVEMQTERLEIGDASLVHTIYGPGIEDVSLEFVEPASEPWYSDRTNSTTIDAAKARQIIDFLTKALGLPGAGGPSP